MFKEIKKGIIIALSFALTLGLIWATYAAWVNLTDVNSWGVLTADTFNKVLENQRDLDNRITSSWSPSWAVQAFYLSSCPTGWSEANGIEHALDLRWTFIRWMNWNANSRDVSRALWDYQVDDFMTHRHSINTHPDQAAERIVGTSVYGPWPGTYVRITEYSNYTWWTETRPKNVALLYCVKD